ncbi:hypothetical protein H4Q26_008458 [Puccinia striiformis f. sp. tritici PST-130]|nr:hypothetical protein H4Q26_008458 [Puccinia striiformis f. sp. tritici PST-130]
MKIIWREEGFRGLYRGLGPTIIGYLPTWAIYFTVYDAAKARLADSRPNHKEDVVAHVLAAMTAGATSTIATNPLWLIKTRFMTQRVIRDPQSERYRHTFDAFKRIHAKEGIRGFYRGLVPSLFGVTHVAIQFPLYEQIKLYYQKETSNDYHRVNFDGFTASKMLASLLTYPHEVLRTRLQVHVLKPANQSSLQTSSQQSKLIYPKLRDVLQIIIKNEGLAGLYHGMGVNLIRTVPSSALTILTQAISASAKSSSTAAYHPLDTLQAAKAIQPIRATWARFSVSLDMGFRKSPSLSNELISLSKDTDCRPPPGHPSHRYALMVDAGSTGSRIHVYRFSYCLPPSSTSTGDSASSILPKLENELFFKTQPGLSSYAGRPIDAAESLRPLLQAALDGVPVEQRHCTPISVKATADSDY